MEEGRLSFEGQQQQQGQEQGQQGQGQQQGRQQGQRGGHGQQQQEQPEGRGAPALRKRSREPEGSGSGGDELQAAAAAGGQGGGLRASAAALDIARAAGWCRRQAVWEQLLAQLQMLNLPFLEECALGGNGSSCSLASGDGGSSSAGRGAGAGAARASVRLAKLSGLQDLERWLAKQQVAAPAAGVSSTGVARPGEPAAAGRPEVSFWLELSSSSGQGPGTSPADAAAAAAAAGEAALAEGAWHMDVRSTYVARLRQVYEPQGVAVVLRDSRRIQLQDGGALYRYCLNQGAWGHSSHEALGSSQGLGFRVSKVRRSTAPRVARSQG